jgi:hypothetical protein
LIELVLFRSPNSANELRRKYRHPLVYAKLRDSWSWELFAAASLGERNMLKKMALSGQRVWIEIKVDHARLFDRDNLWAAAKPILDALVGLHFLAGDSDKHIDLLVVQEKGSVPKTRIRMEILR